MGASSFVRIAKESMDGDNVITTKIAYKKNIAGQVVSFTEYVEDENSTISKRSIDDAALLALVDQKIALGLSQDSALLVADLSAQIIPDGIGPYVLPSTMKVNTLAIYLNGQMINDECTIANSAFTVSAEFAGALTAESALFAIYVEQE